MHIKRRIQQSLKYKNTQQYTAVLWCTACIGPVQTTMPIRESASSWAALSSTSIKHVFGTQASLNDIPVNIKCISNVHMILFE